MKQAVQLMNNILLVICLNILHIYFEGQTIEQLTDRLKPQYSDREASKFMFDVVEGSFLSWRSWAYDRQQFIINEIPYKEHT